MHGIFSFLYFQKIKEGFMKKKFISLGLAFALSLTCAVCLTACGGGGTKHYYTQDLPEHCEIAFQGQTWDDKGFYVLDGENCDFWIDIEEGYECSDFKLTAGATELTPTETQKYAETDYVVQYKYSFTPTADFEIKATGNFTKIVKQITMSKTDWYDETDTNNNELFIRFKQNSFGLPTSETIYSTFVKTRLSVPFTRTMSFGDCLEFDVYYKGTTFFGDPSVADGPSISCNSIFYHDNGEIGYHFTYTQSYEDSNVTFGNYTAQRIMFIIISENSGMQNSLKSDKLDIIFPEANSQTVTITLKDYENVSADVLSGLKLKINGENQNINFSDDSTNGVFTINLKDPWEYGETYSTSYEINLNFYEFDYFNGVVELPPVPPIE